MAEPAGAGFSWLRELVGELQREVRAYREDTRGRFHELNNMIAANRMLIRDLEEFRRWSEAQHQHWRSMEAKYVPIIDDLVSEDRVATAVGEAMRGAEARGWTKRERFLAYGLFVFAALGAIGTVFTILVWIATGPK